MGGRSEVVEVGRVRSRCSVVFSWYSGFCFLGRRLLGSSLCWDHCRKGCVCGGSVLIVFVRWRRFGEFLILSPGAVEGASRARVCV